MTQAERRLKLIEYLLAEGERYASLAIPTDADEQFLLLRALMNVRPPKPICDEFLALQDEYLGELSRERGIVDIDSLEPVADGLCLRRGDITRLRCDAIVNAANSGMTGCYQPNHACIDNAIHTFAGVQLRLECDRIVRAQGHDEPTGRAKITPAYNLPSRFVLHTVGPRIAARVRDKEREQLASCYRACLDLADENGLESIAFCCISTGVFRFPNDLAAEIAVSTVREHLSHKSSVKRVIFNVFKPLDEQIYRRLLG